MLALILIIIGITLGTILTLATFIAIAIWNREFAKDCIRSLVMIGKEFVAVILDCL